MDDVAGIVVLEKAVTHYSMQQISCNNCIKILFVVSIYELISSEKLWTFCGSYV